jgi:hypothetical protein
MYPPDIVCGGLPMTDSEKMLARNTPAQHFQSRRADVLEISLSAQQIDATVSLELFQNVQHAARGSDLQHSAVPNLVTIE